MCGWYMSCMCGYWPPMCADYEYYPVPSSIIWPFSDSMACPAAIACFCSYTITHSSVRNQLQKPSFFTLRIVSFYFKRGGLTFIFWRRLRLAAAALFCFSTDMGSGCMSIVHIGVSNSQYSRNRRDVDLLTGMTRAAKVLPRTTLLSYMMFCGATLL